MPFTNISKIELHCHLDGSLSPQLVKRLLHERGEDYEIKELKQMLQAPANCASLSEYLRCFDLPNEVLQQPQELEAAACELAMQAAEEQVKYIEVRFAPQFSTAEGLSVTQILESVIEGLRQAKLACGIESGVIVCGMRGLSEEANLSMLKEARQFLGCGVVGCDLAGDEKYYPVSLYTYFFEAAGRYQMPFTIHAGECGNADNIRAAIELGAARIGHGIAMYHNRELQQLCADKRIGVELCPTSNLQTQAISDFRNYPLREFMDAGIPVSVNTDNRTVSDTNLTREFTLLQEEFSLQEEVFEQIYRDSVACSFASDDIRHKLLQGCRQNADTI